MAIPSDPDPAILLALAIPIVVAVAIALVFLARRRAVAPPPPARRRRPTGRPRARRRRSEGWELLIAVGAGFVGYPVAEIVLAPYPHPSHWGFAAAVGVLGYGSSWAWTTWRQRSV